MTRRLCLGVLLLGLGALAGACADAPAPALAPPDPHGPADTLRMNQAWLIGTHNSYWVDRGLATDLFASGVQQSLLDQLVADHARALEIDVHPDPRHPHRYRVFHTVPGNSLCDDLADCLRPLRLFHAALPRHEVVHVIIELKEFAASSFDDDHGVDDLERILEESLGTWLYRPRDLLAACDPEGVDPDPELSSCLQSVGWPTLAALRGRFVVSVLGNFDDLLPQAKGTLDWARFTLHGDLRERAAFSMASSWKLDWDALPDKIQRELSRAELERARQRTAFLQVEDVGDPNLPRFLSANAMVRIGGASSVDAQRARIALGAQILQGDTPWIQADDRGLAQPLRPLDASLGEILEPGAHVELVVAAGEQAAEWRDVPPTRGARWTTLPSVGGESAAVPCLAASALEGDTSLASLAICREKLPAPRTPGAPLGSGAADAEALRLSLRICRDGRCEARLAGAEDLGSGDVGGLSLPLAEHVRIGVMLGLRVEPRGGRSCARALAAVDLGTDGEPAWFTVAEEQCFARPLVAQGLLALGVDGPGAAAYAGTKLAIDGRVVAVAQRSPACSTTVARGLPGSTRCAEVP